VKRVIAIAADCEFTCFDKVGGDILSTGLVEILEDFTLGREAEFFSRPESSKYFSPGAQEKHGISLFKAMTFPERRQSCLGILHWLKPILPMFPLKFVYHGNGGLDHKWLQMHFDKEEMKPSFLKAFPDSLVESTLTMAREKLKQLPDHKLPTVAGHYGIEFQHHSALSDARAAALVYCSIMKGENIWTGKLL
jgi:DNA polymerase III epsilon subunit-like protein